MQKWKETAGADEKTPSRAQYFSWVNSTNEGSTEAQTLANLEFFKFLRDRFGMQLDIYAWDAGNMDGSGGLYAAQRMDLLAKQYPNGYKTIADAAAEIGCRLGVWGGPDGYGDDPATEAARQELLVSLCRDHHFALFKLDGVCGGLREEKQPKFVETMQKCRKYSPDLIVLNHRLPLGIGEPYVTTFLWNGTETYVDVHIRNPKTAMHHREFVFSRGNVPGLERLAEDHGVCISSCPEYFEDDLMYQAFGRELILAPEIYGNPWFLRDCELPTLAAIYSLHRKYRDILVQGMLLAESYGSNAVSRGDGTRQFLCTGNDSWNERFVKIKLDAEIGLHKPESGKVSVILHHPYTEFLGTFAYGEAVEVPVHPFRAALIECCHAEIAEEMPRDCAYRVLHRCTNVCEKNGCVDEIEVVAAKHPIEFRGEILAENAPFDHREPIPEHLGKAKRLPAPDAAYAKMLYEYAMRDVDNDSLETRAVRRAGTTEYPAVAKCRHAFFAQDTYRYRGCDHMALFDNDPDTFFDGRSRTYSGGQRLDGGCLRVDFGEIYDADTVEIEYYATRENPVRQILPQIAPGNAEFSADLVAFTAVKPAHIAELGAYTMPYVVEVTHGIAEDHGVRCRVTYTIGQPIRYFRLPNPMDRLFSVKLTKNGAQIATPKAHANNLMAPDYPVRFLEEAKVVIPRAGKLAIAVNGEHGAEGVAVTVEIDGKRYGCPDRAVSYPSNMWEHFVITPASDTTFYFPVTEEMAGKSATVTVLFREKHEPNALCGTPAETDIYWCPMHV